VSQEPPDRVLAILRSLGFEDVKYAYQWREETPKPDYVSYPMVPKGLAGVIVGREKSGKSKLVYALLTAIERGDDFLGQPCQQSRVMMFQEEPATIIKKHTEEFNLGPEVKFPITRMGNLRQIKAAIEALVPEGYGVFCIDTASRFLGLQDENNPAEVAAAIRPFEDLASKLGVTVLINVHANKTKGAVGLDAVRGSTAYSGTVSQIVLVEAVGQTSQRKLGVYGRLEHNTSFILDHDTTTHEYTLASKDGMAPPVSTTHVGAAKKLSLGDFLSYFGAEPQKRSVVVSNVTEATNVGVRTAQRRFEEATEGGFIKEVSPGLWTRTAMEVLE
jgi:hypothetical protein